ncbi:helix-turn-helix domain-containing protein [Actinomadura nitritigenes]|uniref:helix-turn-helix domain-containing protein n=1 Tax=Actinomadura nitritigenes TaxID=134602 RepID=UPI003D94B4F1
MGRRRDSNLAATRKPWAKHTAATRNWPSPSGRLARAELDAYVAGHHLKELRKAIGKTQAEVAQILGVSQSWVSQIENGRGG